MQAFREALSLKSVKLRDTHSRRLVLQALAHLSHPSSPKDIFEWAQKEGEALNLVTVYRVLDRLEEARLVHKHPSTGLYVVCTLPDVSGHHGFLHCTTCGNLEEFHDHRLCHVENEIAKKAGFTAIEHLSEISGMCSSCSC